MSTTPQRLFTHYCEYQLGQAGTIGELARLHGVAAVVAALTEVTGCSSCITDSIERGTSVRALVERMRALRERR